MKLSKAKMSFLAAVTALAIALSGTFAWQSISQKVLNEAKRESTPGGRLHDDFSGWGEDSTKDIYAENFGTQPIYARVRLDEYMEIGQGAGLRQGEDGYGNKNVTVVNGKPGADINDMDTWSTHIPGSPAQQPGSPSTDQFHDYWTWVMGGQAGDNPNGETVYMPTFNKNKDSLMGDVNGTWDGTDPTDDLHYDDYVRYTAGDTADGVRDTTVGRGAFYDCDDNTTDEGGAYGNGGIEGTNFEVKEETHTAKKTQPGKVLTMAEYKALSDAEKEELEAWVYDADGWAYWSQPIQPDTATGLLLDRIILDKEPADEWYYGINAVGQFITAGDLGREDNTGFYDPSGAPPTEDALDLLEGIGVNTSSVNGSVLVTAQAGSQSVGYATPGMSVDLSAQITVSGQNSPDQSVTWELKGAQKSGTRISGTTLTIDPDEPEGTVLTLVARSTAYDRLKGQLKLKVQDVAFTVDILDSGSDSVKGQTVEIGRGKTAEFTVSATSSPAGLKPAGTWTWESSNTGVATVNDGTVTVSKSAAIGATATITATNGTYNPALTASFTVEAKELTVEEITPGSTDTVTIDGIEWYVLAKQQMRDKNGAPHTGALLLSKDILEDMAFSTTTQQWKDSNIRPYLNGSWLNGKSTISSKAIEVNISTRDAYNTTNEVQTADKVFLLSEADVFGTSNRGMDTNPQSWEYTTGAQLTTIPNNNAATGGSNDNCWWLRSPANPNGVAHVLTDGTRNSWNYASADGIRPAFWYDLVSLPVTYTLDVLDSDSNSVKGETVEINRGKSEEFAIDVTSDPAGVTPTGSWTWTSSDTGVATVSGGTVTVPSSATPGATATITVTNSDASALTASFTVEVGTGLRPEEIAPGSKVTTTIDGIEWYVLAKEIVLDTSGTAHNGVLLLSKNVLEGMTFSKTSSQWKDSGIRSYLNDDWLTGKNTITGKAIPVTIATRDTWNTTNRVDTDDKIFLLSEADVFGTSNTGADKSPQSWEYTVGAQLTTIPNGNIAAGLSGVNTSWWVRSPGYAANGISNVDPDGALSGNICSASGGVRPAFWYDLGEVSVTYTLDILDSSSNSVKSQTVEIARGRSAEFTINVTSDPAGVTPPGTWTWTSSNTSVATVDGGTVTISDSTSIGSAAYITVTNSDIPALNALVTVKARDLAHVDVTPGSSETVTIDGEEWYVLAKQEVTDTSGNVHNAALMLTKEAWLDRAFHSTTVTWPTSNMQRYLNRDMIGRGEVASKAIQVTTSTRETYDSTTRVDSPDKLFLLSEADVFGTANMGSIETPEPWEYTAGAKLTFPDNNLVVPGIPWWTRTGCANGVTVVNTEGNISSMPYSSTNTVGLRYAFWYNLDE